MEPTSKDWSDWSDALSEQNIPATVVNWDSIVAQTDDSEMSDSEKLDAEATLEDTSPLES